MASPKCQPCFLEHVGGWKKFAKRSNNEAIFKYSVTLLDNIGVIVVGSEREERRLLDVFWKRRISRLPDTRRRGHHPDEVTIKEFIEKEKARL